MQSRSAHSRRPTNEPVSRRRRGVFTCKGRVSERTSTRRREGLEGAQREQHDGHARGSHGSKVTPPYPYVDPVFVLCSYSDLTTGPGSSSTFRRRCPSSSKMICPIHLPAMTSTYFCADAAYRVPARWTGGQLVMRWQRGCGVLRGEHGVRSKNPSFSVTFSSRVISLLQYISSRTTKGIFSQLLRSFASSSYLRLGGPFVVEEKRGDEVRLRRVNRIYVLAGE